MSKEDFVNLEEKRQNYIWDRKEMQEIFRQLDPKSMIFIWILKETEEEGGSKEISKVRETITMKWNIGFGTITSFYI